MEEVRVDLSNGKIDSRRLAHFLGIDFEGERSTNKGQIND